MEYQGIPGEGRWRDISQNKIDNFLGGRGGVVVISNQREASRVMDATRSTCLKRELSTAKKLRNS